MEGGTIVYISIYANNRELDDSYMKHKDISKFKLLKYDRPQILPIKLFTIATLY